MNPVIGDNALDTAQADLEGGLAQFLRDDLRGGVRVEKDITQDLTDHLVGAAVIGFRAGLLRNKASQATLFVVVEQLVIALAAVAVLLGDGADVIFQALAFDEHEEALGLKVGGRDGQSAGGANQTVSFGVELKSRSAHGERIR